MSTHRKGYGCGIGFFSERAHIDTEDDASRRELRGFPDRHRRWIVLRLPLGGLIFGEPFPHRRRSECYELKGIHPRRGTPPGGSATKLPPILP